MLPSDESGEDDRASPATDGQQPGTRGRDKSGAVIAGGGRGSDVKITTVVRLAEALGLTASELLEGVAGDR